MKFHLKRFLAISSFALICIITWNSISRLNRHPKSADVSTLLDTNGISKADKLISKSLTKVKGKTYEAITCVVNEEFEIQCLQSKADDTVYVPFSLVHKFFEINGQTVDTKDGRHVFEWSHSYSKVYFPKQTYNSSAGFLWFDNYNVDVRDRVRCVSAVTGVPISSQWLATGHSYPIQIAQFGLSHFSKHLTSDKPRVVALDSGDYLNRRSISYVIPENAILKRVHTDDRPQHKVLSVDGMNIIMKIKRKSMNDLFLGFDVKPLANFSLTAIVATNSGGPSKQFSITYTTTDSDILVTNSNVIYGMGTQNTWKSLTRDLTIDLQKGLNIIDKKQTPKTRNIRLIRLEMSGQALLDNIRLMSSAHEIYAKTAGDWFVANQESNGGFIINVNRKLGNGALQLKSGWYSAMAQGQAISLLTRLYKYTLNDKYLNCAKNALNLFDIDSKDNGIRTKFIDKYVWFEEYPTIPSTYVLNGFIYSLFGLYDLSMSGNDSHCVKAGLLYKQGVQSLQQMLPLYDSGSGSLYDLRHLGLGSAPNRARWDYHSTHINQLLYLNTIENQLIFQTTAKRWISYMKGYRAPHN